MNARWDHLLLDCTLVTLANDEGYGVIKHAALGWHAGLITFAGAMSSLPAEPEPLANRIESVDGAVVTPGLVDCHTHMVFAGGRADEFQRRLHGESYEAIARAGGGILSTVRATRAASEEQLFAQSLPRARGLLADGVTTIEIKSGYGLDLDTEFKMLRVARRIGAELGVSVRTTLLALHALPSEFATRRVDFVNLVRDEWLPAAKREGLVDAVDAFCEGIGFAPDEVKRVFERADELGLPLKLHADQLSSLGGGALAAQHGALSADHLECATTDDIAAMGRSGTVAVLLPGSFYALRETHRPPVATMREHGVSMAVATDLNPGTSPLCSLRLAMNMACTLFRLTPEEALRGATVNAARALGLNDRGRLTVGQRADVVIWNIGEPAELAYWIGGSFAKRVFAGGLERQVRHIAQ